MMKTMILPLGLLLIGVAAAIALGVLLIHSLTGILIAG